MADESVQTEDQQTIYSVKDSVTNLVPDETLEKSTKFDSPEVKEKIEGLGILNGPEEYHHEHPSDTVEKLPESAVEEKPTREEVSQIVDKTDIPEKLDPVAKDADSTTSFANTAEEQFFKEREAVRQII